MIYSVWGLWLIIGSGCLVFRFVAGCAKDAQESYTWAGAFLFASLVALGLSRHSTFRLHGSRLRQQQWVQQQTWVQQHAPAALPVAKSAARRSQGRRSEAPPPAGQRGRSALADVLHALPADARAVVFCETFSRQLAGCRLASRELRELHDSAITHVRLRVRASPRRLTPATSPLAKFTRGTRLSVTCELTLPGGADPLSVVLAGTTPEARRRFTHVAVRGCGFNGPHLLQALAAQLPSLTVLEVSGGDSKAVTTGICSNMPATYLARLQRLDLELQTEADMASVGALAACHQLRDLKLTAGLSQQRIPRVSQASGSVLGDALSQLQSLGNLQHLALRCFILDDYGDIPLCVLGSRRPPNLRNLELEISEYRGGEPTLAVVYERGLVSSKVATAAAGGGWGMRRIQLSQGWGGQLDELAAALLAVADGLRQRIIPELVVQGTWSLPPSSELLEPEAPLPRLLARCAQVEVEGELLAYGADSASTLLAAFRLMGLLPHVLWLQHGEWRSREAASAGGAATASAAAATCTSEGAQPDLLASQLQQRRLGRC